MKDLKKPRRSPGEARRQIIEAARAIFARHGYDGTSLRDVAQLAGVNEALIFRSVGSKELLFREAVIEPYHAFVSGFVERWQQLKVPLSNQKMMDQFTTELYSMLKKHRELILALVAARAFGDADVHHGKESLISVELDRLVEQTTREIVLRGAEEASIGIVVRCVVGLIMSFVLLDEWLLPSGDRRPNEKIMLKQISRFAVAGLEGSRSKKGSRASGD